MMRRFTTLLAVPMLIAGLLAPKVSALLLHVHPGVMAVVICTGTEMIVVHVGPNGEPIEDMASDHQPCIAAHADLTPRAALERWFEAPRSYRHRFVAIPHPMADETRLSALADVRGPPRLV